MVSVMKLEKAPLESYADIGGLDQQIQEIKVSDPVNVHKTVSQSSLMLLYIHVYIVTCYYQYNMWLHVCYNEPVTIYSGTSLLWTPLGQVNVSWLESCSHLRASFVHYSYFRDSRTCMCPCCGGIVLNRQVPLYMHIESVKETVYYWTAICHLYNLHTCTINCTCNLNVY